MRDSDHEAAGEAQHFAFRQLHGRMRAQRRHRDHIPALWVTHPGAYLHPGAVGAFTVQRGGYRAAAVDDEHVTASQMSAELRDVRVHDTALGAIDDAEAGVVATQPAQLRRHSGTQRWWQGCDHRLTPTRSASGKPATTSWRMASATSSG